MLAAAGTVIAWQLAKSDEREPAPPPKQPLFAPMPDAAEAIVTPPIMIDAPVAVAKTDATKPGATKKPPQPQVTTGSASSPPPPVQPPLRPLNNPRYGTLRAYDSMMTWCQVPIDAKNPDPNSASTASSTGVASRAPRR